MASKVTVAQHPSPPDFSKDMAFSFAVENIPDSDIDLVLQHTNNNNEWTREEIAKLLATNRWSNKICEHCWNKKNPTALKRCKHCCLAFYCNQECQLKDWKRHQKRCGKKDGPLDEGPQEIVFPEIANPEVTRECKNGDLLHIVQ